MKKYFILALLILAIILLPSCAKKKMTEDRNEITEYDLFSQAQNYYDNEKWSKAIDALETFLFTYPASKETEKAQYYLANSYYNIEDWTQAIIEYNYFINNYNNVTLREECYYRLSKAYFNVAPSYKKDQTLTQHAIASIDNFLSEYPDSKYYSEIDSLERILVSRLEEKKIYAADYYMKNKDYMSAEVYLDNVDTGNLLKEKHNDYYLKSIITKYKLKKFDEVKTLFTYISENSKEYKKAKKYIDKIK